MRENSSLLERIADKITLGIGTALLVYTTSQSPMYAETANKEPKKEYMITQEGINLIKQFEGYSGKVYFDSAGKRTIGYGHLIKKRENYNSIDKKEAEKLLRQDVGDAEKSVQKCVVVPLTQNQYNALVSFVYNIGSGNFAKSTLLKRLNAGNLKSAAAEFDKWRFAGGKKITGLVNRRKMERELFEK